MSEIDADQCHFVMPFTRGVLTWLHASDSITVLSDYCYQAPGKYARPRLTFQVGDASYCRIDAPPGPCGIPQESRGEAAVLRRPRGACTPGIPDTTDETRLPSRH